MRQLKDVLSPFLGKGISLRVEQPGNKIFLSRSTGKLSVRQVDNIKAKKPLLILILPEGKVFSLEQIVEALDCCIRQSERIQNETGIDIHAADLKSIPEGRGYLKC